MNKKFGLLGESIKYSHSPKIHHAFYDLFDACATYELIEIPKEIFGSEESIRKLKEFDGFNVTIPYKEKIMPFLDAIDTIASRIGAVNTVVNENGKLKGYNTDYYGFIESLRCVSFESKKRAIVLGTGGVAKMAVIALEDLGFEEIVVVSRNAKNAQSKFPDNKCIDYQDFNRDNWAADLLVNCTPIGQMQLENIELIENKALSNQKYIFDLNYNPSVTRLLAQGDKLGVKGRNGILMLVAQALKADQIWLGVEFDLGIVTEEILSKHF